MLKLISPELLLPGVELPLIELPTEDGIPLETNWHRMQMNLLIESVHYHWREREDYFTGGNMFIYFSVEQVRNRDYRGPDFFVVKGVDSSHDRAAWIVWEEYGKYPNVIVELSSPSTIDVDVGTKKDLYERTFRTPEYFCFDPTAEELIGWRFTSGHYEPIDPNEQGWLWSEEMDLWLGVWRGEFQRTDAVWLRFYTAEGHPVLISAEAEAQRAEAEARQVELEAQRADAEAQRADAEARRANAEAERANAAARRAQEETQRANAAEAELARLRARLASVGITYDSASD